MHKLLQSFCVSLVLCVNICSANPNMTPEQIEERLGKVSAEIRECVAAYDTLQPGPEKRSMAFKRRRLNAELRGLRQRMEDAQKAQDKTRTRLDMEGWEHLLYADPAQPIWTNPENNSN